MRFKLFVFVLTWVVLGISVEIRAANPTVHSLLKTGKPNEAVALMKTYPDRIHQRDRSQQTPLHIAARFGHVDAVRWLLDNDADVNALGYNQATPLHLASDPNVVDLLLKRSPDLSLVSAGATPFQALVERLGVGGGRVRAHEKQRYQDVLNLHFKDKADLDLISAIRLQRTEQVKQIIDANPKLAHKFKYIAPLREAAYAGAYEICNYLIEDHQVDVNAHRNGYPTIISALPYPKIVKLLIDNGVDLHSPITWTGGRTGRWVICDSATALHFAARDDNHETISLLIDAGVPLLPDTRVDLPEGQQKQSALDVAAIFGQAENAKALLSHPKYLAKLKSADGVLDQALRHAANRSGSRTFSGWLSTDYLGVMKELTAAGADPLTTSGKGESLLQLVSKSVHPTQHRERKDLAKFANYLHQLGASWDLFSAVAFQEVALVNELLKKEPSRANARRIDGYPALAFAVASGNTDIVKSLLDHKADVNIPNKSGTTGTRGQTPLHAAVFWEQTEIAKLLVQRGAKLAIADVKGKTALHDAAYYDRVDIAKLLIDSGALKQARDTSGKTPRDLAKSSAMTKLLQ